MNRIKISSIFLILILALSLLPVMGLIAAAEGSYTIPHATFDLYVQEDGNLRVKETLHYSFDGTFNGVYRDIPIQTGERIENINVSTEGAYSTYVVTNNSDMTSLKIYLYSDSAKTFPISNKDVVVTIEYNFINVVKIYNDVAGLQFKVWGEYWDVDVGGITTNVHLKSQEGVKYWLNPPYYVSSDTWDGSVLNINTNSISPGNFFEVRLAIPKDQFATNTPYAQIINNDGLPIMEKIQQDYQNQLNFYTILYSLLAVLMVLSVGIPIFSYLKYGREPESTYHGTYERELPTNDPPAVVNAISGKGKGKQVGTPTMEGFQATIMDLINRGYLGVSTEGEGKKKSINLELKTGDLEDLDQFEKHIIYFFRRMSSNDVVNLKKMQKRLKNKNTAKSFKSSYDSWASDLEIDYLEEKTDQLFIKTGATYIKYYGILAIIVAGVVGYFTILDPLPAATYAFIASIIMGIAGIISIILPQKVGGRWTQEGVDYDAKWQAFKKYIQDFSLIKEYPPESVIVWNQFLVYATALGVADKVEKSMKMSLPKEDLDQNNLYNFHYYGGSAILLSSLNTGMSTATEGEGNDGFGGSGGVGGVGGGSGGGGGGAF